MRDPADAFHRAIPAIDLDETVEFDVAGLGCHLARRYAERVTLNFFGDQVVCHVSDRVDPDHELYPRHFEITFRGREDFDDVLRLAELRRFPFFRKIDRRFEGAVEAHLTFARRVPSNNLIEFKHHRDHRMVH